MKSKLVNRSIVFLMDIFGIIENKGYKKVAIESGTTAIIYISTSAMCCTSQSPLEDWRDFNSFYGVKAFINIPATAAVFSRYMHNIF